MSALLAKDAPAAGTRAQRVVSTSWVLVAGVLLTAANLRTAVTSVGPLLEEIRDGLGTSATVAGILTTLPVLSFAALGGFTPALARRFGERKLLTAALLTMSFGLVVRAMVDSTPVFLAASALALAGGAVGNVAIPAVVKRHFPDRVGPMTTAYSTALAVGTMVTAALTVPLEQAFDGNWHLALGVWVVPALLAVVPWLLWRSPATEAAEHAEAAAPVRRVWRSKLAWMMVAFFGMQSLIAYVMFGWLAQMMRDTGHTAGQAGVMQAVFTAISIPVSLIVPSLAARMRDQKALMFTLVGLYLIGLPGLWLGRGGLQWLALVVTGVAMGTFPLILTLFGLRTRTPQGTAAISAFAQSGGYLIAGSGPLLVGVLYQATGGWAAPFTMLLAAAVVALIVGAYISRPLFLEDELAAAEQKDKAAPASA
ncbi:CynX/NimT family MFS transporter [Phytomonospora endophytica]|uniref:CP family cyanate transporter-like MFS transporter n=1 Tax=Phytomonospora endophytica TaxID=714109 RepID=A0A841FTY8_9ACTN|nr:MFS transporter [Phytomonospora endophytica]MBB6039476.1 CP family cyanate transporter-like MFS transporter [Phytomonospora endophytica]GIG70203.1 MFS transporter [Phytomonospora endophytica]